jgi:hypothetical protein
VLLETSGILWKLPLPCTGGLYPVSNLSKNGKIKIQIFILSQRVNIRGIAPLNKDPQLSMMLRVNAVFININAILFDTCTIC